MTFDEAYDRSYLTHAKKEFLAAGWTDEQGKFKDEMQEELCKDVLAMLEVFSAQGHSGMSAPYAISLFEKLAKFEPIVPLTGEDWEWNDVGDGIFQNNRCSRVFKQAGIFNGQAYNIDGKVFREWKERDLDPDEPGYPGKRKFSSCYTSRASRVPVTFPYIPTTEYVDVDSVVL